MRWAETGTTALDARADPGPPEPLEAMGSGGHVMTIDIRCGHELPDGHGDGLHCQLLAGHDGKHGGVSRRGASLREIWLWSDSLETRRSPYRDELAQGLPWAPGMPVAEFEAGRTF